MLERKKRPLEISAHEFKMRVNTPRSPVLFHISGQLCRCWHEAARQRDLTKVGQCQLSGTEGERVIVSKSVQERINKAYMPAA